MKTNIISCAIICLLMACGEKESTTSEETVTEKTDNTPGNRPLNACTHHGRQVLTNATILWKNNYNYLQQEFTDNVHSQNQFFFPYSSLKEIYGSPQSGQCHLMEVYYYMGYRTYEKDGMTDSIHCPKIAIGTSVNGVLSEKVIIENGEEVNLGSLDTAGWHTYNTQHNDAIVWVKSYSYKWSTVMDILDVDNAPDKAALALQIDMVAHSVSPYSDMFDVPNRQDGDRIEGYYTYDIMANRVYEGKRTAGGNDYSDFAVPCPPVCGTDS